MPGRSDVRAAGTVLWRRTEDGDQVEVALVHRPRYDDWSLPKGKLEPDETLPACAVRETEEETGFRAVLGRRLPDVTYQVGKPPVRKTIQYYAGHAGLGAFQANDEVDRLCWRPVAEAVDRCSYADDQAVLAEFSAVPADTATVLLVRHAKAGSRSTWDDADELRPLSTAGQAQERALRDLLPLYGPKAVHAAPRVRCEQTVAGVAANLGVSVESEPALTEEAQFYDPATAARRLRELVRGDGAVVVCSQGGAIPGLISGLAKESGLPLGPEPLRCKKASVWVLSFAAAAPHRLLAADYLPSPLPAPRVD
jgi:8-oxo-dGTP diphosphatase